MWRAVIDGCVSLKAAAIMEPQPRKGFLFFLIAELAAWSAWAC